MPRDIRGLVDEQVGRSRLLSRAAAESSGAEAPRVAGPVITISRQYGIGGLAYADRLADRLGWSVWDRKLVDAIAEDAVVSRKMVESFDERTVSEIDVLARTLAGDHEVAGFMYRRHLARALLSIARYGFAIILGRGANFLLPGALNVRLIAGEEYRVERLREERGSSREAALHEIREGDRQRAAFIRQTFDRDVGDPTAYDLVVNASHFSLEGVIEIIIAALRVGDHHVWRPTREQHVAQSTKS